MTYISNETISEPIDNESQVNSYLIASEELITRYNLKDEAMEILNQASSIKENYAPIYNSLGIIYLKDKQNENGVSFLKKAIEINSDYALPHFNLGKYYILSGEYQTADYHLKQVVKIITAKLRSNPTGRELDGSLETMVMNLANSYANIGWMADQSNDMENAINFTKAAMATYSGIKLFKMEKKINNALNEMLKRYGFDSYEDASKIFKVNVHLFKTSCIDHN